MAQFSSTRKHLYISVKQMMREEARGTPGKRARYRQIRHEKIVKELPFKGPGLRGSYVKIVLLRVQRTMWPKYHNTDFKTRK